MRVNGGLLWGLAIVCSLCFTAPKTSAAPPRILFFGPAARYPAEHQPYAFTVRAVGSHRLIYNWWHQEPDARAGHQIPEEYGVTLHRPTLIVQNALPNRDYNGWYWCVVMDSVTGESTISPRGTVQVVLPPKITRQPANQTVALGGTATFTVQADPGAPVPIYYRWYRDGRMLLGAYQPTLTIRGVRAAHGGYYTCRVITKGGSTYTSGALLTVQR